MNSKRSLSVVPLQIERVPGSAPNAIVDNRLLSYSMFSSLPVCVRSGKSGNRARAFDRRFQARED